jgi:hypothetical protein
MAQDESSAPLRRIVSELEALLADARERGRAEAEERLAGERERSRAELADRLNQATRRIRQTPDVDELCAMLVDAAGEFASGAALFRIEGDTAKGDRIRGVSNECAEHFQELEIPLAAAPALAGAADTRDPVTTATSPSEVSARLAALAGHGPADRASIFPVVAGEHVPALVYAWGVRQVSAIELLTQVAGAVWIVPVAGPPPVPEESPELVQIAPAPPKPEPASTWESLPPEEQQIHLRAQRFARVHVAEMRLFEPEAVQTGRTQRNLYEALRQQIDSGRARFRQDFFGACASMVDYFHLELVRTLANDDAEMLGMDYPGPMM